MHIQLSLDEQRKIGDQQADEIVALIQARNPSFWGELGWVSFSRNNQKPNSSWEPLLLGFVQETSQLPAWADTMAISRAQSFFVAHQPAILLCLGMYSLPFCYAAAKGAKVLYFSQRLRDNPGKRLMETASFVVDVCEKDAFSTQGRAFRSIQKVRLIHALSRYYLSRQPYWDMTWGKPVNQEDMAGTNLAFSLIVLRGLRKLGLDVPKQTAADFLHLWSVIGHLMGIERELLTQGAKEALSLEKQIMKRHFRRSVEGVELNKALLDYMVEEMARQKIKLPAKDLMKYMLGTEICDILNLEPGGITLPLKAFLTSVTLQNALGFNFSWANKSFDRVDI